MARSKKTKASSAASCSAAADRAGDARTTAAAESVDAVSGIPTDPTFAKASERAVVSAAIIFHFSVLLLGLMSNLAPSYLQGELSRWLAFYSVSSGQDYGLLPLELMHAEPMDFPLTVQVRQLQPSPDEWRTFVISGDGSSNSARQAIQSSRWPNFARMLRLIIEDQPESEILSDIALQIVRQFQSDTGETFDQVRFLAPPVPSYDEELASQQGQGALLDGLTDARVLFSAQVVRLPDGNTILVPSQEKLRTTKPIQSAESPQ